ncbi:IS630 family transposase [Microvirga yunnanensis]|uniref:IS630 family transposase n=1 Tax=Microvirga yunnanensis TaxID=2953740 RepID=UPI0021CA15D9|nr:IS630 family transposase [Microvirga sp. HBU65207]
MAGKHINRSQVDLYLASREQMTQVKAAALAHISVSSARRIDNGSWHPSPPKGDRRKKWLPLWHNVCVPYMVANPHTAAHELVQFVASLNEYETTPALRRALQRRVKKWKGMNNIATVSLERTFHILRAAHQGVLIVSELSDVAKSHRSINEILSVCKSGRLTGRNKALLALALLQALPLSHVQKYIQVSIKTLYRWKGLFVAAGFSTLIAPRQRRNLMVNRSDLKDTIFKVLHEPPVLHGFPRTNWRAVDLKQALQTQGLRTSLWTIRRIIRAAKYQWRKAKIVLTSSDPDYREKVDYIKGVLKVLSDEERFFFVDEFGPFRIRSMSGKQLCKQGEIPSVPQWQKGRGTLIIIGALEISSNQISHFYSEKKNTAEMIKMVEHLRREYKEAKKLYISWDAASWHISKKLSDRIEFLNGWTFYHSAPLIELAPLPSRAQLLNVIEAVFSGMSRAVIHNSNFENVEEAKGLIDRYFADRNHRFKADPQRAGRKIWGREPCLAVFKEENNCKDPRY